MADQYQGQQAQFWTRKGDVPAVVGDFLGRIPTLDLLSPLRGEQILEAGSGAGFFARQVARRGAKVFGCDIAPDMLAAARAAEEQESLGIQYKEGDMCRRLPFADSMFDAVVTVGVLMHVAPYQMPRFARQVLRVLKPGGRFVLSTTSSELYRASVGFIASDDPWIRHERTGKTKSSGSYTLREFYRNKDGIVYRADKVWSHEASFIRDTFANAGLAIEHEQRTFVTRAALDAAGQNGSVGHPAFYQLKGRR